MNISLSVVTAMREAAKCVTGAARRSIQALAAQSYCAGSSRHAETVFGWNRAAVARGIEEAELGTVIKPQVETRGSRLVEVANPELAEHVDRLCGKDAQADPKFQTVTIYDIFGNVKAAHERAERDPSILRISIDCKAKVKTGPFSRGGKTRNPNGLNAADHDMGDTPGVTPCGILEVDSGQLCLGMIVGTTTSDSIVDTLERWWQARQANYPEIRTLMIDLDNGPDVSSHRTQFIKRMTQFADQAGLKIELVYYPPYHSKYNPVERCWSGLERHWNGSILMTIRDVIKWAETMTWKQLRPILWTIDQAYKLGVKLSRSQMKSWSSRLQPSDWTGALEPNDPAASPSIDFIVQT